MKFHVFWSPLSFVFILVISADPDIMPPFAAFHLGLYCLPKYLFTSILNEMGQSSAFAHSECQRINQFIGHVNQTCTSEINRMNCKDNPLHLE